MDQAAAWTTPVVTTTGFFILYTYLFYLTRAIYFQNYLYKKYSFEYI